MMSRRNVALALVITTVITFSLLPALQIQLSTLTAQRYVTRGILNDEGYPLLDAEEANAPQDNQQALLWKGLLVAHPYPLDIDPHQGWENFAITPEKLECSGVLALFGDINGMTDGYDILGDDEDATAQSLLSQMMADQKPIFTHIIAHGCMDNGIPVILLADGPATADKFKQERDFDGVELVFINVCYAMADVDDDQYEFGSVLLGSGVHMVIGPSGTPWGWAAAFMGVLFWVELITLKEEGSVAIALDNLDAKIDDAFIHAKEYAKSELNQAASNVGVIIGHVISLIVTLVLATVEAPTGPAAIGLAVLEWLVTEIIVQSAISQVVQQFYSSVIVPSIDMYRFVYASDDGGSDGGSRQGGDAGSGGSSGGTPPISGGEDWRPGLILDPPGGGSISVLPG